MVDLVELSHIIVAGMPNYPGLPAVDIGEHLTHADSRPHYDDQAEFAIGRVSMVGNTGTYLDSPYHRFPGRSDIAALPLHRLVDLPAVVLDVAEQAGPIDLALDRLADGGDVTLAGSAVLLRSGWDRHWGAAEYWHPGPFLDADAARALVAARPALVGVDFANVDDTGDPSRPVHTGLLDAGILIVEHLCHLGLVPALGARFSAVPLAVVGAASMPVRAWARLPG